MPQGFYLLIAAQFVSALADNALLVVAMALLQHQGLPAWWAPLLKFFFTIAYVLLAPVVGAMADAFVKARLMMAMNGLKALGVAGLLLGLNPLLAMMWIGVAAAAYAPAKYGLLTELVGPDRLVRANAWIEVTTVCAVLFGAALGGLLVSLEAARLALWAWPEVQPLDFAVAALLLAYACAALLNIGIPDSGARYPRAHRSPLALLRSFSRAQDRLWQDPEGRLSMSVTTLFWGVSAVMQFAVLQWAMGHLGLALDRAAYLQAVVAVGIMAGAAVAGRLVALRHAWRVLPLGVLMGLLVPLVGLVDSWVMAVPLLMLVVPLNALLQHRGHLLLTSGRSIAVQNFNENLSVLVMLLVYTALLASGVGLQSVMTGLGLLVSIALAALYGAERRWRRRTPRPAGHVRAQDPSLLQ